jgi:hypothetical protein
VHVRFLAWALLLIAGGTAAAGLSAEKLAHRYDAGHSSGIATLAQQFASQRS